MDVHAEIRYLNADPRQVFALTVDPKFRGEVCEATHALNYDVDVDVRDDDTATVKVRRTMPAEVPDVVRRFVGETIDVVQTEDWAAAAAGGARTAKVAVEIKGMPAGMTGILATASVGDGARMTIDGDLTVSIPFVGKKIEPEIAKAIMAASRREQEVAARWLGEPA